MVAGEWAQGLREGERPVIFRRDERAMKEKRDTLPLEDIKLNVRLKLFALWSSVMFFYIYGDYFELYQPGKLQAMIAGRTALGAVSQGILLGMAAVMVIPGLMVFLSLVLPSRVNRWLNVVFGAAYTVIMILAIKGGWHFYIFFGLIEITLTALIVWYAWTWPKQQAR
ncbi:MAG: DUF6326 family protein [Acidobacteriaceae bacterium]